MHSVYFHENADCIRHSTSFIFDFVCFSRRLNASFKMWSRAGLNSRSPVYVNLKPKIPQTSLNENEHITYTNLP